MVTRVRARKAAKAPQAPQHADIKKASMVDAAQHAVVSAVESAWHWQGERMSKVDTAWLRMDSDANLMMIVGVLVLKPGIRVAPLRERLRERLLKFPRFGQCVVEDASGASWVRDAHFDMANHLVIEKLDKKPKGREQEALQDRISELTMLPLDRAHPLWQFHLVEHYQGGSALIARIHHCIADGIALISVTHALMDGGAQPPEPEHHAAHHAGLQEAEEWIAGTVVRPITHLTAKAIGAVGEGAARYLDWMKHPQKGLEDGLHTSAHMAQLAFHATADAAALVLMANDSPTRLKGTPGPSKRVAWCKPLPLAEVKAVSKALHCSINDVLLSCVAGSIGSYLKGHGDDVAGKEIRTMIPVNLRPIEKAYKLGNQFGLAPMVLPIGIDNPVERIYEVRRRMQGLKGSFQPVFAYGLLALVGVMPKPMQSAMLGLFSKKTTAVMTNVPGPREKLLLCGCTVEEDLVWVPQSGTVGLGISILSYGGGVQFGVVSDATLCPDPQTLIDQFWPEFAKLATVAQLIPSGS
jgi:diacylglycerol O-acyltransferase